ncbi:MAG TPA: PAS domain-containing sensor histidine kinase [Thermomicrobiales bacterium]|nr:PAS domain-containing sensor histidine kinase [Thermomicrobiales bacterium]
MRMIEDNVEFVGRSPDDAFRLLVESVTDYAIFLLDPAGHVRTWNAGAQRIKGYTAGEIIGQHFSRFYTPEDRERGKPALGLHVAATEGRWEDEGWRVRKDGTRFWASVVITALHDPAGQLVGFAKVTRDLTGRKHAEDERSAVLAREQAARAAAEAALARLGAVQAVADTALAHLALDDLLPELLRRIRALLAVDTAVILLLDETEPGTLVARAAVGLEEEVERRVRVPLGRGFAGRVAAERRPVVLGDIEHTTLVNPLLREKGLAALLGVPLLVEGRLLGVLHVGTLRPHRFAAAEVELVQLVADRVALAVEQQRLHAAARSARTAAAAAAAEVRARDTFLSIAAHELRTPVTALKGTAQLMQRQQARGVLDEARLVQYLARLETAADRLAALTSDLLDVSRLRTGQLPLHLAPVDLAALVSESVSRAREVQDGRHQLTLTVADGLAPVLADAARLEQVLTNLLDNAAKYSPAGGAIAVTVQSAAGGVELSVRDEGIGLPPGSAEIIFEPFGRAPNATEHGLPGLGLGLYICRNIVTRHGGQLWAESAGDQCGTTFRLWLPAGETVPERRDHEHSH